MGNQEADALPDVKPEVGGNLLVAAEACVELEAKIADGLDQLQLDEMMNILSLRVHRLRNMRSFTEAVRLLLETKQNPVESIDNAYELVFPQNGRSQQSASVRLAGHDFLRQQRAVELDGALPG